MKKKITSLTVLVCIALFIPLVIAILFAMNVDPNSVTVQNLKTISVTDGNNSMTLEDEASFELYSSITENSREVDAGLRAFDEETPYLVTFTEEGSAPITYKLYMSANSADCVYVSPDGKYFIMDQAVASKLIVRDEFSSLNTLKSLPILTLTAFGKDVVLTPDSYVWSYTALDGTPANAQGTYGKDNAEVKFDNTQDGLIKISFDKQPDSLHLEIKKDGEIIFDDKYENLALANSLTYSADTKLSLVITAQWYEIEGAESFGEATYSVPLYYDIAPTYEVADIGGVYAGDFTVLRITNFNEGEKLTVINDIGIPEKINVYTHNTNKDKKIAFIPMRCDLAVGSYDLLLETESGHQETVAVKVKTAKAHDSYSLLFSDEDLEAAFTEDGFNEFASLVSKYTSESVDAHLYEGKFVYPNGKRTLVLAKGGAAYGTKLKVISRYTNEYVHEGVQLEVTQGQNLTAANNGTVVYADASKLYGNLVIIDHGCGVLSYYGNLDSISVKSGDSVTFDTVIGTAGSTGFACVSDGVGAKKAPVTFFAFSFDGVFIDPASPCSYGINIGN